MFTKHSSASKTILNSPKPSVHMEDIRTKLNFSMDHSPLLIRSSYSKLSPPNSRHLGSYHMSRQNPAVLDRLHNGDIQVNTDSSTYKTVPSLGPKLNRFLTSSSGVLSVSRPHSIPFTSAVKQNVNNNGHMPFSEGRSSLVQLAARGSPLYSRTRHVSPVLVKLAQPERERPSPVPLLTKMNDKESENAHSDPCDKNVVVSALKQKRKRWWSTVTTVSPTSNNTTSLSHDHPLPLSKKPRTITGGNPGPTTSSSSNKRGIQAEDYEKPSKKVKSGVPINNSITQHKSKRLFLPDMEVDVSPLPNGVQNRERKRKEKKEGTERSNDAGDENSEKKRKCATPPVHEEEGMEEDESRKLKLKREATLKLKESLTKVYPSPSRGVSVRKKAPILCATGSKPHMVDYYQPSLATQEAVKKDREAASKRVESLLTSDDLQDVHDSPTHTSTTTGTCTPSPSTFTAVSSTTTFSVSSHTSTPAVTTSIPSSAPATAGQTSASQTSGGLKLHTPTLAGQGLQLSTSSASGGLKLPAMNPSTGPISSSSIMASVSASPLNIVSSTRGPTTLNSTSLLSTSIATPTIPPSTTSVSLSQSPLSQISQNMLQQQHKPISGLTISATTVSEMKSTASLTLGTAGGSSLSLSGAGVPLTLQTSVTSSILNPICSQSSSKSLFGLESNKIASLDTKSSVGFGLPQLQGGGVSLDPKPRSQTLGVGMGSGSQPTGFGFGLSSQTGGQPLTGFGLVSSSVGTTSLSAPNNVQTTPAMSGSGFQLSNQLAPTGLNIFSQTGKDSNGAQSTQSSLSQGLGALGTPASNQLHGGLNTSSSMQGSNTLQGLQTTSLQASLTNFFNQASNPLQGGQTNVFNQTAKPPQGMFNFGTSQNSSAPAIGSIAQTTSSSSGSGLQSSGSGLQFSLGKNISMASGGGGLFQNTAQSQTAQVSFGTGLFGQNQQLPSTTTPATSNQTGSQQQSISGGFNFSLGSSGGVQGKSLFNSGNQQSFQPQTANTTGFGSSSSVNPQQQQGSAFQLGVASQQSASAQQSGFQFMAGGLSGTGKLGFGSGQAQPSLSFGNAMSSQQQGQKQTIGNGGGAGLNSISKPSFNFSAGNTSKPVNTSGSGGVNSVPMFGGGAIQTGFNFGNQSIQPGGINNAVPGNPFGGGQLANQNSVFQFGSSNSSTSGSSGLSGKTEGIFGGGGTNPSATNKLPFQFNPGSGSTPSMNFNFSGSAGTPGGINFSGNIGTSGGISFSAGTRTGTGRGRTVAKAKRQNKK